MVDISKALRTAVDTGQVLLGSEQSVKSVLRGEGKLVVLAKNCPDRTKQSLAHYAQLSQIPILPFEGSSLELGTVCGKPHPISVLTVLQEGHSDILQAITQEMPAEAKVEE
jgi:large subunit ribosomal protein L30e